MFYFEREREGDSVWVGEGQREGDTESKVGSRLWTVSPEPDAALKPMNHEIMTWAEGGGLTDWTTQVPHHLLFFLLICSCFSPPPLEYKLQVPVFRKVPGTQEVYNSTYIINNCWINGVLIPIYWLCQQRIQFFEHNLFHS